MGIPDLFGGPGGLELRTSGLDHSAGGMYGLQKGSKATGGIKGLVNVMSLSYPLNKMSRVNNYSWN